MAKGKTVKKKQSNGSGPPWYSGGKSPCFKTHPTVEEFQTAHDQAQDIVQDTINIEEQKLEEAAKDPRTKRCLQRSHKKTESIWKNQLTYYGGN